MAEQEACADLVERATEDARSSRTSIQGESLLLPLLQGLLDNPDGTEQTHDSGTESGEDHRTGLIQEVQTALDKLTCNLKMNSMGMSEERRNSLLQLVVRLQQGLSTQLTPSSSSERRASFQESRFRKKQNRHSRHTVGVTSEELEDARRLMEEIGLNEMVKDGLVKVKNSIAKPFVSTQSSGSSSTVDTPTETSEPIEFKVKESDEDDSTVKDKPKPDLILQTNPIYRLNEESDDEFAYNEKANRFNTKKLKMKRANTIDIPKPLKYYECDDDESDNEEMGNRRNSYLALRGPIHVGKFNVGKKVPEFEPKTENDKKFLAFINKQNNDEKSNSSDQVQNTPPWVKTKTERKSTINSARNFWKSADDAVSAGKTKTFGPKISRQSARNLQQMFEEKQRESQNQKSNIQQQNLQHQNIQHQNIQHQNLFHQNSINQNVQNKNLQNQNHKNQNKWDNNKHVVTGSLKVDTKTLGANNVKVIAQPNPINKFSYNPMNSAFRPVKPQKSEKEKEVTYLYSPKPFSPQNLPPSPVETRYSAPWSSKSNESSRVLSIAASKFENRNQKETSSPRAVGGFNRNSSVRKLSGQYDSLSNQDHQRLPQSKYHDINQSMGLLNQRNQGFSSQLNQGLANQRLSNQSINQNLYNQGVNHGMNQKLNQNYYNQNTNQFNQDSNQESNHPYEYNQRVFVPGENYTIQYETPKVEKPNIYNAEYMITQKINFPIVDEEIEHNLKQININQKQQEIEYLRSNQPDFVQDTTQNVYYREPPVFENYKPYNQNVESSKLKGDFDDCHLNQDNLYTVDLNQVDLSQDNLHKGDLYESKNVPQNLKEEQFTSNYNFTPKLESPNDDLQEHTAVSSRVMTGPVGQVATVQSNSPKKRDEHDFDLAMNLRSSLQKLSQNQLDSQDSQKDHQLSQRDELQKNPPIQMTPHLHSGSHQKHGGKFQIHPSAKSPIHSPKQSQIYQSKPQYERQSSQKMVVYNNVTSRKPMVCLNDKPMESLEINEDGESILTSKFHIQVKPDVNVLSKSESWHQICQGKDVVANKPSPRASPNSRLVTRSKSSHSLAVPKQYEAGMSKQEMAEKQKSLQAYFGGVKESTKTCQKTKQSSINRVKTSQKISTQRQNSTPLSRSQTLPDVICLERFDDDDVDQMFEEIFKSST